MVTITGDGLKTFDAVRDTFAAREIEPSVVEFERLVAEQPVGAL